DSFTLSDPFGLSISRSSPIPPFPGPLSRSLPGRLLPFHQILRVCQNDVRDLKFTAQHSGRDRVTSRRAG
ncbi:hypothetical protein, partial [Actinomadura parmotrematis]